MEKKEAMFQTTNQGNPEILWPRNGRKRETKQGTCQATFALGQRLHRVHPEGSVNKNHAVGSVSVGILTNINADSW